MRLCKFFLLTEAYIKIIVFCTRIQILRIVMWRNNNQSELRMIYSPKKLLLKASLCNITIFSKEIGRYLRHEGSIIFIKINEDHDCSAEGEATYAKGWHIFLHWNGTWRKGQAWSSSEISISAVEQTSCGYLTCRPKSLLRYR